MRLSAIGLLLALGFLVAPLCSNAQQPGKVYRIGVLAAGSPPPPSAPTPMRDVFLQRLQELGWIVGQNIVFEGQWAEGRFKRLPALATELVQLKVDLILVWDGLATVAAK